MIRLATLLVGAPAFKRIWWTLPLIGALWVVTGLGMVADIADGVLYFTLEVLGIGLMIHGLAAGIAAVGKPRRARAIKLYRAATFFLLGLLIALPMEVEYGTPDRLLFGVAFLLDGILRAVSAYVVRFSRWQAAIASAVLEVAAGVFVMGNWPISHHYTVPVVLGLVLIGLGFSLITVGLQLRSLAPGASITTLPLYAARGWYHARHSSWPGHHNEMSDTRPMTLYVWTAVGSSHNARRWFLIDRYIAAVDEQGVVSTGHSALECLPEIYISHYPAVEIDHSPDDFTQLLRAGKENDVPGKWQPDHATEVAQWCRPDQRVDFPVYNATALRDFWEIYRADSTYNLTSRSCSTVTTLAIESALEGVLASRRPFLTFFLLLLDPALWMAAMVRRRGATMAWTPGLVLDYARLLKVIVARRARRWPRDAADTTQPAVDAS